MPELTCREFELHTTTLIGNSLLVVELIKGLGGGNHNCHFHEGGTSGGDGSMCRVGGGLHARRKQAKINIFAANF